MTVVACSATTEYMVKSQVYIDAGLEESMHLPYVRAAGEATNSKNEYEVAKLISDHYGLYMDDMKDSSSCYLNGMGNCNINFLQQQDPVDVAARTSFMEAKSQAFTAAYQEALADTEAKRKLWVHHQNDATVTMSAFIEALDWGKQHHLEGGVKAEAEDEAEDFDVEQVLLEETATTGNLQRHLQTQQMSNKVGWGRRRRDNRRRRRRRRSNKSWLRRQAEAAAAKAASLAKAAAAKAARLAKAAAEALQKLWNTAKQAITNVLNSITDQFNTFKEQVSDYTKPVMDKIKNKVNAMKNIAENKMVPSLLSAIKPLDVMIQKFGNNLAAVTTCNEGKVMQRFPIPKGLAIQSSKLEFGPITVPVPKPPQIQFWSAQKCKKNMMLKIKDAVLEALNAAKAAWMQAMLDVTEAFDDASSAADDKNNLIMGCYKEVEQSVEFEWVPKDESQKQWIKNKSDKWSLEECAKACNEAPRTFKYMALVRDGAECRCSADYATNLKTFPRLPKLSNCGAKGSTSGYAVYRLKTKPCSGDYAVWFRMGGSISIGHGTLGAALGVAIGCDGQGHRFALPTVDYGVDLSAVPNKTPSKDVAVNIDFFTGAVDGPTEGNAAWQRIGGFGMGISATVGEFGFAMSTTFPGIKLPHPNSIEIGKNPVTKKPIRLKLPIIDPRHIEFVRPQIAGFGMSISPTVVMKAARANKGAAKSWIKEMLLGDKKPDLNVGIGIGWVGFLEKHNWFTYDDKPIPLYNGDELADIDSELPWENNGAGLKHHFNEFLDAIFPGWSPLPKLTV